MGALFEDFLPYIKGTQKELKIWKEMASRYFPGALTLVLPAQETKAKQLNPLTPTTIGIRIPDLQIARDILSKTNPLATTSANLSGFPPLRKMDDIAKEFSDVLTLKSNKISPIIGSGLPSTVAKWTGKDWQILRQGSVKL